MDNTPLNPQNSSYPTQPYSIIAKYTTPASVRFHVSIILRTVAKYALLTKREDRMAGDWTSSFFCVSMDHDSVSVQYPAILTEQKEVKPWSQDWLIAAGAYPGFCSMKRQEVFLLSLDGMLVHRRSLPAICQISPTICRYPFIHLGGERHCESKVSCPRTQHDVPGQGSNPDRSNPDRCGKRKFFSCGPERTR